jgi:hypothetical protein
VVGTAAPGNAGAAAGAAASAAAGGLLFFNSEPGGNGGTAAGAAAGAATGGGGEIFMNSNAGLVTGEYFQDHQTAVYQSQGRGRGIDLQYSSAQADSKPVVQYQFTTPVAGDSSAITWIKAQVTLAGVVQGAQTYYSIPSGGLADGTTYNIPLQVDASSLATGVYPYTMTVTENFGGAEPAVVVTTGGSGYVNVVNITSAWKMVTEAISGSTDGVE